MGENNERLTAKELAMYIGQEAQYTFMDNGTEFTGIATIIGINLNADCKINWPIILSEKNDVSAYNETEVKEDEVKLLLRPLSDMTEEEKKIFKNMAGMEDEDLDILTGGTMHLASLNNMVVIVQILTERGFDLFNWIPSGKALDKTKTNGI